MSATEPDKKPARPVTPRNRARRLAVQTLYGWLLNPRDAAALKAEARQDEEFPKADAALLDRLLDGVTAEADSLRARLSPYLDRSVDSLSPVEHVILLMGAHELVTHVETPYRVIISEAIELAKRFGGTDGHKYVNGVLDKLAGDVRADEKARRPG